MTATEKILAVDIGAGSLRVGEFSFSGGELGLVNFDWRTIFAENEGERATEIANALRSIIDAGGYSVKNTYVCTSGQSAFVRFVKLPPVSSNIDKVIEYEAQQHIPFSMDEVSWDYQLLSSPESGEIEVMFVVIKNEIVEKITEGVTQAGLTPALVELSSAALLNAARANHIGSEECVMLLDIGDRCSDLIFIDGNRFFTRTIPIAGNTITQQIAKEFKIEFDEAEDLKKRHGFVSLGGAYEEPESEVASVISKIIRNVMTRLHSEINRTKTIYCTQQKGNAPTKLFLTGGSSIMAYTDTFFAEKLKMEVNYFNPFGAIKLAPGVEPEKLERVAHMYGATIGTALRKCMECPIEINLMPKHYKEQEAFKKRKMLIVADCVLLIVALALLWFGNLKKTEWYKDVARDNEVVLNESNLILSDIRGELEELETMQQLYTRLSNVVDSKKQWQELFATFETLVPEDVNINAVEPVFAKAESPEDEEEEEDTGRRRRMSGGGRNDKALTAHNAAKITSFTIKGSVVLGKDSKADEKQFESNLRSSKTFDKSTKIVKSPAQNMYDNLRYFEILATLKTPISVVKE